MTVEERVKAKDTMQFCRICTFTIYLVGLLRTMRDVGRARRYSASSHRYDPRSLM